MICSQCSQEKTACSQRFWEHICSMMTNGWACFLGLFPMFPKFWNDTSKKVCCIRWLSAACSFDFVMTWPARGAGWLKAQVRRQPCCLVSGGCAIPSHHAMAATGCGSSWRPLKRVVRAALPRCFTVPYRGLSEDLTIVMRDGLWCFV